jgi:hypothetical protein
VRKDKLIVEDIRSGTCAAPNAAVELGKVDWCGPNSGASPAQPVGSTVDKVMIHPYRDDKGNLDQSKSDDQAWTVSKTQKGDGTQTLTLTSVS